MRVTQVTYTRVKSDQLYGNHQAGVVAQVDESDDPAQVLACARELACQAVGERPLPGVDGAPWCYVGDDADDVPELGDEDEEDLGDSSRGYYGVEGDREQRVTSDGSGA